MKAPRSPVSRDVVERLGAHGSTMRVPYPRSSWMSQEWGLRSGKTSGLFLAGWSQEIECEVVAGGASSISEARLRQLHRCVTSFRSTPTGRMEVLGSLYASAVSAFITVVHSVLQNERI